MILEFYLGYLLWSCGLGSGHVLSLSCIEGLQGSYRVCNRSVEGVWKVHTWRVKGIS